MNSQQLSAPYLLHSKACPGELRRASSEKSPRPANEARSIMKQTILGERVSARNPIGLGIGVDAELYDSDQSTLRRLAHLGLQWPVHYITWPFAFLVGIWAALFWRAPTEDDVIALVEGTGLITVLHRGLPPGAGDTFTSEKQLAKSQDLEKRHYYVDVKQSLLELVRREPGINYEDGVVKKIKSWSMSYTKTRPIGSNSGDGAGGGDGDGDGDGGEGETSKWQVNIHSFIVNGKDVTDPASQMAFLHCYLVMGAHAKSHVFGNALVHRIYADESLKDKLMESTWTTTWLHDSLLHGKGSPMTPTRMAVKKWMGIGHPLRLMSLVDECRNMTTLGGAKHASTKRWKDLELPFADFWLGSRHVLRRAMRDNDIPMDLLEAMFLSIIVHATDHVQTNRLLWGTNCGFDWEQPSTMNDHREKATWNVMFVAPKDNPFYHNKIWRISKPFYRQLYQGLKKIDTLDLADQVTASIMY